MAWCVRPSVCTLVFWLGCCRRFGWILFYFVWDWWFGLCVWLWLEVKNRGPKIVKNGPRVWAFCKIEFPGIQKPVQIFGQKWRFFRNPGNRGVGVIWLVRGLDLAGCV